MEFFNHKNNLIIAAITFIIVLSIVLSCFAGDSDAPSPEPDSIESMGTEERSYNFLILGRDDAADLCDVIIIVSYDTKSHKIEALQIPRDTYASYTNSSYRKLNGAVSSLGGIDKLADFIEESIGIHIDYYVSVDLDTLSSVIDRLGGVEVNIPEDMSYHDPYQNLFIDLGAGKHTLNGDEATQFLRYRAGYATGDIGRLDAQKIFLSAIVKKILTDSNIGDMTTIALNILPKLESNLSASDCMYFISQIKHIELENIAIMTMPGEAIQSQSGAWYYIINREEAYKTVKDYFSPSLEYESFDKSRVFTSIYREGFNVIYDAKNKYKIERYTADIICRDGININ